MPSLGEAVQIGPFIGGLNTFSDDSSIADNELVECDNFELDLDGSLVSRPPIVSAANSFPLDTTGNVSILGYYYGPGGVPYLIASDGASKTYYFDGTTWVLITNTFAAAAMTQYNGQAWMMAPTTSANPGGYWTPTGGFTAQPNMPKGDALVAMKQRLWAAAGKGATTNGTRLYFSKVLGDPLGTWIASPDFIDVGSGDGQNIVQLAVYFQTLLMFRTSSIMGYSYSADPATGNVATIVPGVGLADKHCIATQESSLYFLYEDRLYQFQNNRVQVINQKVPFRSGTQSGIATPFGVSSFDQRIIVSYWDKVYVLSLRTNTWTTWSSQYGSLSQFIELAGASELISAVTFPSKAVPSAVTDFINLAQNPAGVTGGNAWSVNGGTGGAATQNYATGVSPAVPGIGLTTAVRMVWTTRPTAPGGFVRARMGTIVPNTQYTASIYGLVGTGANRMVQCAIRWLNSSGTIISTSWGAISTLTGTNTWQRLTCTATAPAGAVSAYIDVAVAGTGAIAAIGDTMYGTGAMMVAGDGIDPSTGLPVVWFSGASTTAGFVFAWIGTANNGNSTRTPSTRRVATLTIQNELSAARSENFICRVRTKTYNYQLGSGYKRLFWWGVEAIFQGTITGVASPVAYTENATWGQLLQTTWGALLQQTWGQLTSDTYQVTTSRMSGAVGALRKFVKFLKALRFRQIFYTVQFTADGTPSTSPVHLFLLMTYVRAGERVSKEIS